MARVMVVDDEPGVREVVRRFIEAEGHEVCEAGDAEAALRVMEQQRADMTFCDIQMPGHDGIWLTRQLRQRYPDLPVVLATSVTTVPPSVSMQCGVLAYLIKPLERSAVVAALGTALAWQKQVVEAGPKPEDSGDRLDQWLAALKD